MTFFASDPFLIGISFGLAGVVVGWLLCYLWMRRKCLVWSAPQHEPRAPGVSHLANAKERMAYDAAMAAVRQAAGRCDKAVRKTDSLTGQRPLTKSK